MSLVLVSALVTFVYVGLRAFQQLNVVNGNYAMVLPTSIFMSVGDVLLVLFIVKADSWTIGITNGIGGGLGCCLAMYASRKIFSKKGKKT